MHYSLSTKEIPRDFPVDEAIWVRIDPVENSVVAELEIYMVRGAISEEFNIMLFSK